MSASEEEVAAPATTEAEPPRLSRKERRALQFAQLQDIGDRKPTEEERAACLAVKINAVPIPQLVKESAEAAAKRDKFQAAKNAAKAAKAAKAPKEEVAKTGAEAGDTTSDGRKEDRDKDAKTRRRMRDAKQKEKKMNLITKKGGEVDDVPKVITKRVKKRKEYKEELAKREAEGDSAAALILKSDEKPGDVFAEDKTEKKGKDKGKKRKKTGDKADGAEQKKAETSEADGAAKKKAKKGKKGK